MKAWIPSLALNSFFLLLLLACAGRWNYWAAWVYVSTSLLMSLLTRYVLRASPELAEERTRSAPGAKAWDKKLLGLGFLLSIATLVIAGLDAGRWHPQPTLAWSFFIGLALQCIGLGLFLLALRENRFFSAVVRIQSERGHSVCTTGPYGWVRHPGYLGMLIGTLGQPLLLGSAWSVVPALLFVGLLLLRTKWEDDTLEQELAGYRDYQAVTPYRVVPWIW